MSLKMTEQHLALTRPCVELVSDYVALIREFEAMGEESFRMRPAGAIARDHEGFIRGTLDEEKGIDLAPGLVPQTTFWLVRDGERIVGEGRLRHRLTSSLEQFGGHIGYAIRPGERRKGYGTLILALTLVEARTLGMDRVLVTCDPANIGSARIIQKNRGHQTSDGQRPDDGKAVSRYWIGLDEH